MASGAVRRLVRLAISRFDQSLGWRLGCVLEENRLGESGVLDRIETNLDGRVAPIGPGPGMPVADPAIAHERVQVPREAIDAEHSIFDGKRDSTFSGHEVYLLQRACARLLGRPA